jgi:hypothetical protein
VTQITVVVCHYAQMAALHCTSAVFYRRIGTLTGRSGLAGGSSRRSSSVAADQPRSLQGRTCGRRSGGAALAADVPVWPMLAGPGSLNGPVRQQRTKNMATRGQPTHGCNIQLILEDGIGLPRPQVWDLVPRCLQRRRSLVRGAASRRENCTVWPGSTSRD